MNLSHLKYNRSYVRVGLRMATYNQMTYTFKSALLDLWPNELDRSVRGLEECVYWDLEERLLWI